MQKLTLCYCLVFIAITEAFFNFNDCDPECQHQKVCCSIIEITKNYFPCTCIQSEVTCRATADSDSACICPDGEVTGGSAIYDNFRRHQSTTTTTRPAPKPLPKKEESKLLLALTFVFSITTVLCATLNVILLKRLRPTRSDYERIPNIDNPYQDTVEPLPTV